MAKEDTANNGAIDRIAGKAASTPRVSNVVMNEDEIMLGSAQLVSKAA